MVTTSSIPNYSGVYIWRYWPKPDSYTKEGILNFFTKLCAEYPIFEENLNNQRIEVRVKKTHFGFNKNSIFESLGLSQTKKNTFLKLLENNPADLKSFADLIDLLIFSLPPLYIGKADNIQVRLTQHFDRKTPVLSRIDLAKIKHSDIYISFIKDSISGASSEATTLMENVLQNITRPPLTKRHG